jgi:hypothetical protein
MASSTAAAPAVVSRWSFSQDRVNFISKLRSLPPRWGKGWGWGCAGHDGG